MAFNNFKPEIWSPIILKTFDKSFVGKNLVNTNYEGEVSQKGDMVRINQVGPVSVSDYGSTGIGTPPELTDAQLQLLVDNAKMFRFRVEDIDKAQATPGVMQEGMRKAAVAISNTVDEYIFDFHDKAGYTWGSSGTPKKLSPFSSQPSTQSLPDRILYAGQILDERNVPLAGRWMVIDPRFYRLLIMADIRFGAGVANPLSPPQSREQRTGLIGNALGFDFYLSNNSKASTYARLLFGTNDAITFAGQISKVEAYRPENWFADAVKGLYLYGAKVVQSDALGCLYAKTT